MPMTPDDYADNHGSLCPQCETPNGLSGQDTLYGDGRMIQGMTCDHCHAAWEDIDTLTG